MIAKELQRADQNAIMGSQEQAKKLYIACAEALNKICVETKDDPVFQKALKDKLNDIFKRIERCDKALNP